MALPAILVAAASSLLPLVIDLFRAKGTKTTDRNADIVEAVAPTLIEIARQLVPGANEQTATETILADKTLQTQFRAQVALQWKDVEPFLTFEEESKGKARDFMVKMTSEGPTWKQIGAGVLLAFLSVMVLGGGGWMLREVLLHAETDQQTRGLIIGFLISAATMVLSYFFGSSAGSKASGDAVRAIAEGRQ